MANPKLQLDRLVTQGADVFADVEETREFGAKLGRAAQGGLIIALDGPLGAGKTHLVQGIAAGLEYPGEVTSPTFTLVHEYLGGRLPLYHFDFYRIADLGELDELGWVDYLDGSGVVIAEWGGKFPEAFPNGSCHFALTIEGNARRLAVHDDL